MANIIIEESNILIRKMEENKQDFLLFLKWMTDPRTTKYWDGTTEKYTFERVVEKYREHVREQVEQCIIAYDRNEIGYCQFYATNAQDYEVPEIQYNEFVDESDTVYGIDIFLGEADCRGHGIGTKCLKALMKALFEKWHADILVIDPKIHNARAIQCYRKCGFRDLFVVPHRQLQDGIYHDNLIMGIKKADFV